MPVILFMIWIAGATVIVNAEPQNYESVDTFKASVERAIDKSEPVDYPTLNN